MEEEKKGNGKTLLVVGLVALVAILAICAAVWQPWNDGRVKDWFSGLPQIFNKDDAPNEDQTPGENQAPGVDQTPQQEPTDTPAQYMDWGDDIGGRPAYGVEDIAGGALGEDVVLNSLLCDDEFWGDTRRFMKVMRITEAEDGSQQATYLDGPEIVVEEGLYLLNAYITNNNPGTVSENTRVGFGISQEHGTHLEVSGWVFCDNATTQEMWQVFAFTSQRQFHLEYIYGSALLWRKGLEDGGRIPLPDTIVTKVASEHGTPVGYDELNGELPGGDDYLVTGQIAIRVVYDEVTE